MVLNTWNNFSTHHRLQTACESLRADVWRARVAALAGNIPVTVQIREDGQAYSIVEQGETPAWRELPQGVKFTSYPKKNVTFYSRGSITPAGTYTLANTAGVIQVIVAASGRSRWERIG
jgi:Tfp pilus assembly protein FimT